ncbi:MAG: nucleotidyltransferase family protein [Armatimonadetes bacterium]|nr:nucleotidyltransferase family protein [Armatimonadota bacterium]
MSREDVLTTLAAHRHELEPFCVRTLALFGSTARDEAGDESDLDLVVEFDGPPTFDRYIELSFYLERLFGRPVDLLTRSSLPPALRSVVEKEACYVPGFSPVPG